jgi:hypothetical protein
MKNKWFAVGGLLFVVAIAFVGGYCTRTALAQQSPAPAPGVQQLPADIHPETMARIGWATRDEFATPEDLAAYDHAVGLMPQLAKHSNTEPAKVCIEVVNCIDGNGLRLHIPVVHTAYRTPFKISIRKAAWMPAMFSSRLLSLAARTMWSPTGSTMKRLASKSCLAKLWRLSETIRTQPVSMRRTPF